VPEFKLLRIRATLVSELKLMTDDQIAEALNAVRDKVKDLGLELVGLEVEDAAGTLKPPDVQYND
jgi:hypothetical protein